MQAERRGFSAPKWLTNALPVVAVLVGLVLLGYPLALLFGLPLALRDMRDLRKYDKAVVTTQPFVETRIYANANPVEDDDLSQSFELTFLNAPQQGVLVRDAAPLDWLYGQDDDSVTVSLTRSQLQSQ